MNTTEKLETLLFLENLVRWHDECPVGTLVLEYDLLPESEAYLFSQHLHCPLCRNADLESRHGEFEPLEWDIPGHPEYESTMEYVRGTELKKFRVILQSFKKF